MAKLYTFNKERGTLHIYGCCQHSKNPKYVQYDSEKEVQKALGPHYNQLFCKLCQRERDQVMKREKLTKKKLR